jgi:hypothetical protein
MLPPGCGSPGPEATMQSEDIPPMAPLAPIVDRMRELARDELPSPRTCTIRLCDDDTFDIVIYHSMGDDERQALRYERTTGEIIWEHMQGADWEAQSLSGNETVYESTFETAEVRVLATVEPPYSTEAERADFGDSSDRH